MSSHLTLLQITPTLVLQALLVEEQTAKAAHVAEEDKRQSLSPGPLEAVRER